MPPLALVVDIPEIEIPDELNADLVQKPKDLDRIVQLLEARDRGFRLHVGKLLGELKLIGGHKLLGYETFNEYCRDGIDLDPRRASRLLRFDRGLQNHPEIAAACWAGKLRYIQALLLLRVVTRKSVGAWVEYAVGASVLHTQRAVEDALLGGTTFAPREDREETNEGPSPPQPGDPNPVGRPPTIRFRIFLEEDVGRVVMAALRTYVDPSGRPLAMGEALARLAEDFLENLNDPELDALRARFPILERDGWRCTVVVCSCRPHLNEHHIVYRIRGGTDADSNQTSLCFVHHHIELHGLLASIVITGTAPDDLLQMIGIDHDGGPPLLVFRGNRKISSATGDMPAEIAPWKRLPMKATQERRPMAASPAPAATWVSTGSIA